MISFLILYITDYEIYSEQIKIQNKNLIINIPFNQINLQKK